MAKKRVDPLPAWEREGSIESQVIGLTLAEAVALAAQSNMTVEVLEIRDGVLAVNMNIDTARIRVGLEGSRVRSATIG